MNHPYGLVVDEPATEVVVELGMMDPIALLTFYISLYIYIYIHVYITMILLCYTISDNTYIYTYTYIYIHIYIYTWIIQYCRMRIKKI